MLKYTVITVLGLVGGAPWGGDRGYVLRLRFARFLVSYKSLASYSAECGRLGVQRGVQLHSLDEQRILT